MELSDTSLQPAAEPQRDPNESPAPQAEAIQESPAAAEQPAAEPINAPEAPLQDTTVQDESAPKADLLPRDKQGLLDILKELAQKEADEIHTDEVARIKQFFYLLRNDEQRQERDAFLALGNKIEAFISLPDPVEEEFKDVLNNIKDKKSARRKEMEEQQAANEQRKRQIIARLVEITADTDNLNRLFPEVRDLQAEFRSTGAVPAPVVTELWKSYQEAVERFYDQLKINKELRDYDFKKNLADKEQIVTEAQTLALEKDIIHAFKRLQDLHERWREIGPVPKEVREEIWARFKEHSAIINKRYQAHFEERKEAEKVAEEAKRAILERVQALDYEGIATNAAWEEMTKLVTDAQAEWRAQGFAARKINNELYAAFREVCDKFFQAKSRYFKDRREGFAQNLAKKTALCEQAEALAATTPDDWRQATDQILALKEEWRKVGPVARKVSDDIWHRFIKACDSFFDNKKKGNSSFRRDEQENLKAKRELIARIEAIDPELPKAETLKAIRDLQNQWQKIGHVPFSEKDAIYDEYRTKCDAVYDRLGPVERDRAPRRDRNQGQSSQNTRTANMTEEEAKTFRERERLTRQYEKTCADLKTYENNMAFLNAKTKSGDSMLALVQKRIEGLRAEIDDLRAKIEALDKGNEE